MKIGLYVGTFDPWTNGHHDVLVTAEAMFDQVIVALLKNPDKTPLFSSKDRVQMVKDSISRDVLLANANKIQVIYEPDKLAVNMAKDIGAKWLIRGIRMTMEYEKELGVCFVNAALSPEIQTIYIPPRQENIHISSTAVRQIISFGKPQNTKNMVPSAVYECIMSKYRV